LPLGFEVRPVPPFETARVPAIVIVPEVVIGPPEVVSPVVPPETSTDVTVPAQVVVTQRVPETFGSINVKALVVNPSVKIELAFVPLLLNRLNSPPPAPKLPRVSCPADIDAATEPLLVWLTAVPVVA